MRMVITIAVPERCFTVYRKPVIGGAGAGSIPAPERDGRAVRRRFDHGRVGGLIPPPERVAQRQSSSVWTFDGSNPSP